MTAVSDGGSALFGVERAAAFHSDGSCCNAAAANTIMLVGATARSLKGAADDESAAGVNAVSPVA